MFHRFRSVDDRVALAVWPFVGQAVWADLARADARDFLRLLRRTSALYGSALGIARLLLTLPLVAASLAGRQTMRTLWRRCWLWTLFGVRLSPTLWLFPRERAYERSSCRRACDAWWARVSSAMSVLASRHLGQRKSVRLLALVGPPRDAGSLRCGRRDGGSAICATALTAVPTAAAPASPSSCSVPRWRSLDASGLLVAD